MNVVFEVVQFPDVLDNIRAIQFQREIEELVKAGVKIILLDLKNVTFISSPGLMALVKAFRGVRDAGGKLFVCSVNEQVRILFELTGVDQVLKTFANLDEFNHMLLSQE